MAAEADFDPLEAGLTEHERRRMDRYIQFAAVAGAEAIDDAALDLDSVDRDRVAVALGSAVGGTMQLEDGYVAVSNRGQEGLRHPHHSHPLPFSGPVPSPPAPESAPKVQAPAPAPGGSTGGAPGAPPRR